MNQEIEQLRRQVVELQVKLRENQDRFSTLFDSGINAMGITSIKEGRIVDINQTACRLLGYTREELIERTAKEFDMWVQPEQREAFIREIELNGRVHNMEAEVRTKSGDTRTVLFSAEPITIAGEPCLLGTCTDITTQRDEAAAVHESEQKYRTLVERSLQGLAVFQNVRFIFCNQRFADIFGYTVDELLALSSEQAVGMIHPADRTMLAERVQDLRAGKEVPPRLEYRGIKKDGSVIWLEIFSSIIDYQGKPAVQAVYVDITERKRAEGALRESEERLREATDYLDRIINHVGDPIFVKDQEHRFVLVNDALCAFTGLPREVFIGRIGREIFPNEPASLWQEEEDILRSGEEYVSEDHLIDGRGRHVTVMAKKTLLTNKSGERQIIGVLRDITEQKQLEVQFLQAQKMEAVGVLAGGVAHDFNNLLSVINGYAELLLDGREAHDPIREELEQIKKAGTRAASLTAQLLAFSRKQVLKPETVSLNAVAKEVAVLLKRLIGENIKISITPEPELGLIKADPGQLQQVIMNLAINARDAMPRGGKLMIETKNILPDDRVVADHPLMPRCSYVMLSVTDTGIGMDAATRARIFEPFFTTKEKGKGTGLGLSTVYGIVKQSNGFVWVESEPGKGTRFSLFFPEIKEAIESVNEKSFSPELPQGKERILVIEDEPTLRALARKILENRGYKVTEAEDGQEALQLVQNATEPVHLVLTDVVMPGLNGSETAREIAKYMPETKFLYMSGYTNEKDFHHGLAPHIAFLQKPFTAQTLVTKVKEVLSSQ